MSCACGVTMDLRLAGGIKEAGGCATCILPMGVTCFTVASFSARDSEERVRQMARRAGRQIPLPTAFWSAEILWSPGR